MLVKPIELKDVETVLCLDEEAGNNVFAMIIDDLENKGQQNHAYGIYLQNDKLVGYCTLGGADVLYRDFIKDPHALLLSDVYVHPDYRNHGFASCLVSAVTKRRKHPVYLLILDTDLIRLYKHCGFTCIDEITGKPCNQSHLMVLTKEK